VIIGKANMHEIGINPIGVNPHHGACRNPYDRSRITGGSSSGSAATVASGLTVADVAAGYALLAGPDEGDAVSWRQSPVHLTGLEDRSLKGLRLGVCRPYFDDADADVLARCREALKACTDAGATIVELPPPNLNVMLWSHAIIILSEMATAMLPHSQEDSSRFGLDVRTSLAIGRHF